MNLTTAQERLTALKNLKGSAAYERAFRDFTQDLNGLTPVDYTATDTDQEAVLRHFKTPSELTSADWEKLPCAAKAVLIMRSALSTYALPLVTNSEFAEFSKKYQALIVRNYVPENA